MVGWLISGLMKKNNWGILLILGILFLVVYRAFFQPGLLVFGDAPYFFTENLKELFNKPLLWGWRGINFGGDQSLVLWLYLPTYLMGFLNHYLYFSSELLIRIVFYFPAAIFSLVGSWYYLKEFNIQAKPRFFGSLLYGFNSYFLTILDGGQIGVGLSYGLFPISLIWLNRWVKRGDRGSFVRALILICLISNVDLRVGLIVFLTEGLVLFFQLIVERKVKILQGLVRLITLAPGFLLLNAFFLLPLFRNLIGGDQGDLSEGLVSRNWVSLIDTLALYNPHFPNNEFGKISHLPFWYGLLPLIILGGIWRKEKIIKIFSGVFLILAFVAKGGNDPLGNIYSLLVEKLPLGMAFRDSTKFYIPLILMAAVLASLNIGWWLERLRKRRIVSGVVATSLFIYLVMLINPAIYPGMSGALRMVNFNQDERYINFQLQNSTGQFRTAFFPERPPLMFSSQSKEAVDGNGFYKELPFASLIKGDYDLYYFLHDNVSGDLFRLLGIKYALFPLDHRQKSYTPQEQINRREFEQFVKSLGFFKPLNWPVSFPAFEVSSFLPKIFLEDRLMVVVGGADIYQFLKTNFNFSLYKAGFVFVEDGLLDQNIVEKLSAQNAMLIFNNKGLLDLEMWLAQKSLISFSYLRHRDWGYFEAGDYLKWRYLLLQNGIDSSDLAYRQGVYYSSIKDEVMKMDFEIARKDRYYLMIRGVSASQSASLSLEVVDGNFQVESSHQGFSWSKIGPIELDIGNTQVVVKNLGGFQAINEIGLVSTKDFGLAEDKANQLSARIPVFDRQKEADWTRLKQTLEGLDTKAVAISKVDPTTYHLIVPKLDANWLVFSDHYHPGWQLQGSGQGPWPFYSMINGFLIGPRSTEDLTLEYRPQSQVDLGLIISAIAGLGLAVWGVFGFQFWYSKDSPKK